MQFVNKHIVINYGLDVEKEESSNILHILQMANIVKAGKIDAQIRLLVQRMDGE